MEQTIGYLPGLDEFAFALAKQGFLTLPFSPELRCSAILYDPARGHRFDQIHPSTPCLLINVHSLSIPQVLSTLKQGSYSPLFQQATCIKGLN